MLQIQFEGQLKNISSGPTYLYITLHSKVRIDIEDVMVLPFFLVFLVEDLSLLSKTDFMVKFPFEGGFLELNLF